MVLLFIFFYLPIGTFAAGCGLYLIPSKIPNSGRGIIAGRNFPNQTEFESNPTIQIPKRLTQRSQLSHYVYGTGDDAYDMIMFGPGSIYNHLEQRTVYYTWSAAETVDPAIIMLPYSDFSRTTFMTMKDIALGDEIFNYYGDRWFSRFATEGQTEALASTSHKYSVDELQQFGHCLTDIKIVQSKIASAGSGVVAAKNFEVGDIVTISPVLILSKKLVESDVGDTVLQNYCIASQDSNIVLFPINYGALINHNLRGKANVRIEWYDWSGASEALAVHHGNTASNSTTTTSNLRLSEKLQMNAQELFNAPFAQLDIVYRATHPISEGEEVFLDYGLTWQTKWKQYISKLQAWQARHDFFGEDSAEVGSFPLFRSYIAPPVGLFPAQWNDLISPEQECVWEEDSGVENACI